MNEQIILDFLDANESIDDECVAYGKPGEYPFTMDEFREFTDKIWEDAGGWDASEKYVVDGAHFETYYVPFERNGKQYWLNVMYGQGSAWTVFTSEAHEAYKKRIAELDGVSPEAAQYNKDVWLEAEDEIKGE